MSDEKTVDAERTYDEELVERLKNSPKWEPPSCSDLLTTDTNGDAFERECAGVYARELTRCIGIKGYVYGQGPEFVEFCAKNKERIEAREARIKAEKESRDADDAARVLWRRIADVPLTLEDRERIGYGKLEQSYALSAVKTWLEKDASPWIVLLGAPGTGKTVAAAYAMAERDGDYMSAFKLRSVVTKALWDMDGNESSRVIYSRCLVIDDLGSEREKDADTFSAALLSLLDERKGSEKTIITSNLNRAQLMDPKRYGERIVDRLNQMALIVQIPGSTMRKKIGA